MRLEVGSLGGKGGIFLARQEAFHPVKGQVDFQSHSSTLAEVVNNPVFV